MFYNSKCFTSIIILTISLFESVKCSSLDMNSINMNMNCSEELYKNIIDINLEDKYQTLITEFEKKVYKNETESNLNKEINHLEGLQVHFNKNEVWDISIEPQTCKSHTIFTFHLNNEKINLNLDKNDLKNFLTKDFFKNFVVPSDTSIVINTENSQNFELYFEIHPIYKIIYSQKAGYQRNIRLIFEFMKGLFTISLKTPAFKIKNGNFTSNLPDKMDLSDEYEDYTNKLKMIYNLQNDSSDNHYPILAIQYISGKIFYQNFQYLINQGIMTLSNDLSKIIICFGDNVEDEMREIINYSFLNIETADDLIRNNINELCDIIVSLNIIANCITSYGPDSIDNEFINSFIIEYLWVIENAVRNKSLSPIVVERIVKENNYYTLMMNYFYNWPAKYKNEVEEAKKFNQKIRNYKLDSIINCSACSKQKIENFVENIIQENINNLYNPDLSCEDYENIFPYDYRINFIAFKIYSKLEQIINLVNTNTDGVNDGNILLEIARTKEILKLGYKPLFYEFEILIKNKQFSSFLEQGGKHFLYGVKVSGNDSENEKNWLKYTDNFLELHFKPYYSIEDKSIFIIIPEKFIKFFERNGENISIKREFSIKYEKFLIDKVDSDGKIKFFENFDTS
ncbi:hypothetical protein DMUE_3049 [Dictyocoela muelleri]|nr:hypothetical protein DMUE_3049 [Dictyocoela muelleri]